VHETVVSGPERSLIQNPTEELSVHEDNLVLFRVAAPKLTRNFGSSIEIKALKIGRGNILEYGRDLGRSAFRGYMIMGRPLTICLPVHSGVGFQMVGGRVTRRERSSASSSGRRAPYNNWKYSSRVKKASWLVIQTPATT
jgi:hypothetical protein